MFQINKKLLNKVFTRIGEDRLLLRQIIERIKK